MDKVEEFKQELGNIEKQIMAKNQELKVLKQYKKSIENAARLKQKVEGKRQADSVRAGTSGSGTEAA